MNCNAITIGQPKRPRWCGVPMVVDGWVLDPWSETDGTWERWWTRRDQLAEAAEIKRCDTCSHYHYDVYPPRLNFPDRFADGSSRTARAAREAADRDLAGWAATGCPLCIPCRFGEPRMWRTYRAPACQ